ncbi:MAG TPA: STAS domain-containing protein [Spirochaetota bacterium]|jgi:anti-anti-sigma factor|nr:STAS domain-containing protein [Spirochaetota bacterium]OQA96319.1 MAG: STAS domain protein [Spirochaetes bacterium ADurb.Bin218]HOK03110.1 STAS domain-containing protein [Spirochaetota bacterium]HOK93118.1 STAS domain-containing protein [Spirochaetota bacterium]HON16176.1 STAS domain-containing protein [Spirochaetota bacterium]
MNVNIKETESVVILEFEGESDPSFIKKFSEVSEEVNKKNKDVEVDLSNATYLDSSTIGILIKIHKNQKQKNLAFTITSASERVMSLLKLCSLSEALQ